MNTPSTQSLIESALAQQQSGQIDEAITLFHEALKNDPHQADAHHGLGLAFAQKQQYSEALNHLCQAVTLAPNVPGFHNNLGNLYKKTGRLEKAIMHYQEALKLKSPYSEAHNNLGSAYYMQGKIHEAISQFQKALRINPTQWNAHFNLANCYIKHDRFLEACPHLEETLKLRPDHLGAANNLGNCFCLLKRFAEAKPLLMKVVDKEPNNKEALFHLGICQASLGELEQAQQSYNQVLTIEPKHDRAHHNLATLFLHLDDKASALKHYRQAFEINHYNQTAQHMILSLEGKTLKEGAPTEYTRALFDQYAYSYNQHVQEKLQYQVPKLLRYQLKDIVLQKKEAWNVLDLGCGTGLCAPYFSDIADKLYGVDLSPKMIDVASSLGAYFKLIVSDINHYLEHTHLAFHLIIAADVFVYFGELENVFLNIHDKLSTNGYFTFSVERLSDSQAPFEVRETGRYAHQADYLHSLCQKTGFKILTEQTQIIRNQEDTPIQGLLYLLQKTNPE